MWWEILNIPKDSDVKTIKIAYAKLLKVTKPDEDHEGFKVLYEAYQDALHYEKYGGYDYYDEFDDYEPEYAEENDSKDITLSHQEFQSIEVEESNEDDKDWNLFVSKTKNATKNILAKRDIEYWKYLLDIESMIDFDFKARASFYLFDSISEVKYESLTYKTITGYNTEVLNYLDNIFSWSTQWQDLVYEFGSDRVDRVIWNIDHGFNREQQFANVTTSKDIEGNIIDIKPQSALTISRVWSFLYDLIVSFVIVGIFVNALKITLDDSNGMELYFGLLFVPVMEATSFRASFGKQINKLVVVNKNGEQISLFTSITRFAILLLMFASIALRQEIFMLFVVANVYLAARKNVLIQDWFTGTYVVELDHKSD